MLREYARALARARVCRASADAPHGALLAMIHVQLGELEDARTEVAEVLRLDPTFIISGTAFPWPHSRIRRTTSVSFGALRKAGLPD
jgi:hypothetical protein